MIATLAVWTAIILAVLGFVVWLYVTARRSGVASERAKVATKTADTLRKMDVAGAKADPTKAGVKKSLEDGTF